MGPSRLIVCESATAVLVGMRRALERIPLPIKQTRSADQALVELRLAPRSVLVAELTAATAEETLKLLQAAARRFPHARSIVVTARGLEEYEPLLRDLGAVHVEPSARDGTRIVELARQHLSRRRPFAPETGRLTDNVAAPLPWGD